jgi:subfamily B ATP-binding cassette protein MsbA
MIETFRRTWMLSGRPSATSASIMAVGVLTALLEGLSLLLFIPLIQSLAGAPRPVSSLERLFAEHVTAVGSGLSVLLTVLLLCALVIAKNIAGLAGAWLSRRTEGEIAHRLRSQIFEQTLSSCIDYRPGVRRAEIVTTLAENSWQVARLLILSLRMMIAAATVLIFGALLALLSWKLLLVAVLFLTVGVLLVRHATRQAADIGQEVVQENKALGLAIWERVQTLQLIRTYGREAEEARGLAEQSERVRQRLLRLDLLWSLPGPMTEVGILLLIGGLILAAQWANVGLASLAAFLTLLYRMQAPGRELMEGRAAMDGMAAAVADVGLLLRETEKSYLEDGPFEAPPLARGIVLERVGFRYETDEPLVLKELCLEIPAGKTTAIVGSSGAGKSTLFSLLCRFHDPSFGHILADGVPLDRFRLASWRERLSLMPQEVQLFHDTIRANIAYARPDATDDEVRAAAEVAHADAFIDSLPDGYDTIVGDRGLRLSGGQRQRVALARTILRGTDILLLDEPTNALDPELEQAFQDALAIFSRGRTVIVIAHRLGTVMRADQLVVLEDGEVREVGAPAEILARSGRFEEMYALRRSEGAAQP